MQNKKTKYDDNLRKILKSLLNDKTVFKKKFDDLQSFKEYLIVYTVDEFIKSTLKVEDNNYKNELHRILKPHVKKLFQEEFKDLIKTRYEMFQNKKKLTEQRVKKELADMENDLRLIRTFLDDSSYKNLDGVKNIGVRLPRPDQEDRIVVVVYFDKNQIVSGPIESITDSIWKDIKNLFGVSTHVQFRWS